MIKKLFILFLGLCFTLSYSQKESDLDSLQKEINSYEKQRDKSEILTLKDSVKCNLLLRIADQYYESDPNKSLVYAMLGLDLSTKINYKKGIGASQTNLAKIYNSKADFKLAIQYATKAIGVNKSINERENLADSFFVLGQSYLFLNDYTLSLKNLNEALNIYEKINCKRTLGVILIDNFLK
jgi:tetratricopeptide (TPR) repeat protein